MIASYSTAVSITPHGLDDGVRNLIKIGYRPYGNLYAFVSPSGLVTTYHQAMVKEVEDEQAK